MGCGCFCGFSRSNNNCCYPYTVDLPSRWFPFGWENWHKKLFFFCILFFSSLSVYPIQTSPPPLHFLQIIFSRLHCRKCFIFDTEFEESKTSSLFVAESTVLQIHFFPWAWDGEPYGVRIVRWKATSRKTKGGGEDSREKQKKNKRVNSCETHLQRNHPFPHSTLPY